MSSEERPLRLLSLDGGGVRGLSSLLILQYLMRTVDPTKPPKPCDYFDLIGGTSTGGLIAIMLGRLKMDIDECIKAYLEISQDVFQPKKKRFNFLGRARDALKIRGRFDSDALKRGIQNIVVQVGEKEEAKLKIEAVPKCRVFVCATRGEMGMHTALLRSYVSKRPEEVDCTIWEAGRATSAASSFFDPIKIGHFDETFVDGGTGCNNPIEKVFEEALDIWGEGARERINCFLSIGTGQPAERGFGSGLKEIASTIIHISTETEQTAVRFARVHAPFLGSSPTSSKVYFRFNVAKGLEEIGLERHEDKAKIAAATKVYLSNPQTSSDLDTCAGALRNQIAMKVEEKACEPTYSQEIIADCLRSLAFPEMDARLHGIETAESNTCGWIFETSQFRNWLSRVDVASHNGVLWIKGKPGAGKSTLMKQILGHFKGSSQEILIAAYFFHGRANNPLQKSPLGMLRSIVYQLLDQNSALCETFLPMFLDKQKKHGNDIPWYFGELQSFILSSIEKLGSTPILLLVDALDECMDDEAQSIVTLLESLACLAVELDKRLNICLASRHYPQIWMSRAGELVVETQTKHDEDIILYVRHNLIVNEPEIEDEILQKSAHVFLWVKIVIEMLNQAFKKGRIRAMMKVLRDVPTNLDSLYSELVTQGRDPDEIRESVCMFQWVLFAQEVLSPEKLYFAVLSGTNPKQLGPRDREKESRAVIQRYITSTSKGLIEVLISDNSSEQDDSSSNSSYRPDPRIYVQFIHESVKHFLLSVKGLQLLDSSLSQKLVGHSHSRLVDCCLSYIMMSSLKFLEEEVVTKFDIENYGDLDKLYPLLSYSAEFLLFHIDAALVEGVPQLEILLKLQPSSKELRRLQNSDCHPRVLLWSGKPEVLNAAAEASYYEIVRTLLFEMKVDVNAMGGFYGNALQAAAATGHEKTVQLCLDHGANVNAKGGECPTALHAAVMNEYETIARILLENGADVNAQSGQWGTVLHEARLRMPTNSTMIDLLLQYGAENHPPT